MNPTKTYDSKVYTPATDLAKELEATPEAPYDAGRSADMLAGIHVQKLLDSTPEIEDSPERAEAGLKRLLDAVRHTPQDK